MTQIQELICVVCPKGCITKVWKEKDTVKIEGKVCKQGKEYLKQEYTEPKRILTSTVVIENSPRKRLPVRTAEAVPKKRMFAIMDQLARVRIQPPIQVGQVVLADVLNTGVDIVASDDLMS